LDTEHSSTSFVATNAAESFLVTFFRKKSDWPIAAMSEFWQAKTNLKTNLYSHLILEETYIFDFIYFYTKETKPKRSEHMNSCKNK
jgi:hypothetical protein